VACTGAIEEKLMDRETTKTWLLARARQEATKGPGFAQQGVVLRAAKAGLLVKTIEDEQTVLDCWHELFREGRLNWGYNLDNPDAPFFHVPEPAKAAG
jgi:hypothetical protein